VPQPKKALGQNFLIKRSVIKILVGAVNPTPEDVILEIGAGTGAVTEELARSVGKVLAVEFDRDLISTLKENLRKYQNIKIINKDILKLDLARIRPKGTAATNFKIVGSIPYQITSPLIHKLIEDLNWSMAALLIQREVARKLAAKPPKATYLSNFVYPFATVEIVKTVPKTAFRPRPKVDGTIIRLVSHRSGLPLSGKLSARKIHSPDWSQFLHHGFSHPRKMLKNVFSETLLKSVAINPQARAQMLTPTDWMRLFEVLR